MPWAICVKLAFILPQNMNFSMPKSKSDIQCLCCRCIFSQLKSQWFCSLGVLTTRKTIMIIAKRVNVLCFQKPSPIRLFVFRFVSHLTGWWIEIEKRKKNVLCIIFACVPRLVYTFTKSCRLRNQSDAPLTLSDEKTYRPTQ